MEDQRGELKGNLELPDFLKIPANHKPAQSNDNFKVPYAPPPPPAFRTVERNFTRPAVNKTLSTPVGSNPPDKMDLMQELSAKLSKRTEPTKNNSSPKEKVERHTEQNELLLDYNFNSRPQPQQEQTAQAAVNTEVKQKRSARPRSSTDTAVYTVEAAHGMRVETGNRPQPMADAEPRKNVAHVHPSIRPQASQPVTVNSLRGMHYATNPRRNTADQGIYYRPNNAVSAKPQTVSRMSSKSNQNLRDTAPAIYDMKPGSNHEGTRMKGYDDSVKYSTAPVDIPAPRKLVSAYSLPEVNSQKAEVHIPTEGGPPPVPRRTVSNMAMDRRPRPKPITNPDELLAGLENTPVSRSNASPPDKVESPPNQNMMMRVGSPLPPPPTPPSEAMYELNIADFSPPPSICESPEKISRLSEYRPNSSSFAQTSASQSSTTSQARTNSGSSATYTGPVAYVNMSGKDVQRQRTGDNRTMNYNKQPITPNIRISNVNASNSTNSTQRARGEDRVNASSQRHTPTSVKPTVSSNSLNKTVTPSSTNERTLVEESPSENATPYTGHRPSMDNTAKRLIHNTGSVPRTRNTEPGNTGSVPRTRNAEPGNTGSVPRTRNTEPGNTESVPRTWNTEPGMRKGRQDSEIPKLDPYVTYEKEDLRITFV
ncbi:hypothetical protein OS493_011680 [Desmophyllum pertusum]|uniref:Uncharacterized protein n=1 Tax=Desmophyllum pertusum TaxID=174260 RepID=A0A9W9YDU8_9CNID|nr:hypothetical protein OS493_011680 [Desmophyllum pertusum]